MWSIVIQLFLALSIFNSRIESMCSYVDMHYVANVALPAPENIELQMMHILSGEAPSGPGQANMMLACVLYADYRRGARLGPGRWNGWRYTFTNYHSNAIEFARKPYNCMQYRRCKYAGTYNDFKVWKYKGLANAYEEFCNGTRCIVCAWRE